MRFFYRREDDIREIVRDGNYKTDNLVLDEDVTALVSANEAVLFDSEEDMAQGTAYQVSRSNSYPSITDQLDQIYHEGIDAWKETIQAVKDAHPKP